jgi:hypothetical protein
MRAVDRGADLPEHERSRLREAHGKRRDELAYRMD